MIRRAEAAHSQAKGAGTGAGGRLRLAGQRSARSGCLGLEERLDERVEVSIQDGRRIA